MSELKRQAVNRPPSHPGAILREDVLPALNISKAEFARSINVSRQMLHDILNESRPITSAMALRLAKALSGSPNVWAGMQQKFDLFYLSREMADELEQIQAIEM
ncbi:MAG: addiction module HigA family antidote [Gammaproteobacteria bacterium]|jgi:addiction module HigA family antidote